MQPALPTTPEAVRQWRRDTCRISQADTAAVLGISRSSIARYEAGKWPVPLWLSWALVGIQKTAQSEIRHRKRRDRFNAKRRKTRHRNARVPRLMRQRLRLSHARMDILEEVLDRGLEHGMTLGECTALDEIQSQIHSLTVRIPRGMRG